MFNEHRQFIGVELRKLIPAGSFASYILEHLAEKLRGRIDDDFVWSDEECLLSGVEWLFNRLDGGEALDCGLLEWADGLYRGDNGAEIPATVPREFTASELMAAYGLSVLHGDKSEFSDMRERPKAERLQSKALMKVRHEIAFVAYQALVYAHKLRHGQAPSAEGKPCVHLVDFSALGVAGAKERHKARAKLKEWATEKYRAGKWSSAHEAAHALTDEVLAYGRTIGAELKPSNAQRTIYKWFLDSV